MKDHCMTLVDTRHEKHPLELRSLEEERVLTGQYRMEPDRKEAGINHNVFVVFIYTTWSEFRANILLKHHSYWTTGK